MLGLLEDVWHGVESIPFWVIDGGVQVIDLLVAAFGASVHGIMLLLPTMPTRPTLPTDGVLGTLNWLFPVEGFIADAVAGIALLLVYQGFRIALAWGKAD